MKSIYIPLPAPAAMLAAFLLSLALLLCLRFAATGENAEPALTPALFGKVIVIDPGHGGWDPGMLGSSSREADINLAISLKLAQYCREAGAAVIMTRESDIALADKKGADLDQRVKLAEQGALFLSIHCNSSPGQKGAQIFYQQDNTQGQLLAEAIQASVHEQLNNTDRSALPHGDSYLLKNIKGPAVICEAGFLSNEDEEKLLLDDSYQREMAWAIFCGAVNFVRMSEL